MTKPLHKKQASKSPRQNLHQTLEPDDRPQAGIDRKHWAIYFVLMDRPDYDEQITRQNDVYGLGLIERYFDQPKTAEMLLKAITEAFILGAGGYEGSFDAAFVLENGGMKVLLESLCLPDLDKNLSVVIDVNTFEEVVRAAVDFGASWDDLEEEISPGQLSDTDITGEPLFLGPLTRDFVWRDPSAPPGS